MRIKLIFSIMLFANIIRGKGECFMAASYVFLGVSVALSLLSVLISVFGKSFFSKFD